MTERRVAGVCVQRVYVLRPVLFREKAFVVAEDPIGDVDVVNGTEGVG